ncbi:MAG: Ig-like domain-containing protein [Chloroflexota bacterium]
MRRGSAFLLAGAGVIAGLVIVGLLGAPTVTEFSPGPDAAGVSGMARVAIAFSQPMDARSVESALSIEPSTEGRLAWEGNTLVFVPREPWPAGTAVMVRLGSGARSARFLPLLGAYEWSFEVSGPRVGYLWPAGSPAQIYLRTLDGEGTLQLTDASLGVYDYDVGLAGTAVVYSVERADGGTDIWMQELQGSQARRVYACAAGARCRAARLSPDGAYLAFEQFELLGDTAAGRLPGPTRVWALDLRQGGEPFPVGPEGHVTSTPSWSPQGLLAYYDNSLRAIVIVDPTQGAEPPPYRYFPSELGGTVSWSPDGAFLVFPDMIFPPTEAGSGDESEGSQVLFYSHLFRADVATGEVVDLWRTGAGLVEDASPIYSPDGMWIAFARKYLEPDRWTIGRQLWLMRWDGSGAHALSDEPDLNHSALVWSPDSEWLAYMRFNETAPTQASEIWLIGRDGEGARRLVVGGYLPQWIP